MKIAKLKKMISLVSLPFSIKLLGLTVLFFLALYLVAPNVVMVLGTLAIIVGVPLLILAAGIALVVMVGLLLDNGGKHWSDEYDTFSG